MGNWITFKVTGKLNVQFVQKQFSCKIESKRYGSVFNTWAVYIPYTEENFKIANGLSTSVSIESKIHTDDYVWALDTTDLYKGVVDEKKCFSNGNKQISGSSKSRKSSSKTENN